MIKTLSPYSTTSKTAEILSRFRPIAPRPEGPVDSTTDQNPSKIRQSPYLRNLWPQLQARPTRTRKRGRPAISPTPSSFKRPRTHVLPHNFSLQGFAHGRHGGIPQIPVPNQTTPTTSLVTLPLLPCPQPTVEEAVNVIDLNKTVAEIPEEKDLLLQLQVQAPPTPTPATTSNIVISPQPIRPVGSTISVGCINDVPKNMTSAAPKKPEEVEEEVESDALPAVISDSNNKVRLANSAYKEMVGQPECSWLDSMVTGEKNFGGKRISGEVMLHISDPNMLISSNAFSCWVRIEWGSEGKKRSRDAYCDVIKLSCESKDYLFTWRFHTNTCREASRSSSNAYIV